MSALRWWLPSAERMVNTIDMHRFRTSIVSLLLLTLQVSSVASAAMGDCAHHTGNDRSPAAGVYVSMNMPPACHEHHRQVPHQKQSSQDCQSLCFALCAGGLTALTCPVPDVAYVLHHDQASPVKGRVSSVHPLALYRPPIAATIYSPRLTA